MGKYEADLAKVVAEQQELANAEKLLDLPVNVYPEIISIQNDMKGLKQIYDVYKAQKVGYGDCPFQITAMYWDIVIFFFFWLVFFPNILCFFFFICQDAKTEWSQTLWVDLNIQLLQEGVEGFIKQMRKLPKDVQVLPIAFFLDGHLKEFRESLPLLLDLKNEALRERSVCRVTATLNWNKSLIETNANSWFITICNMKIFAENYINNVNRMFH